MGVRGLSSFICNNPKLVTPHELHDTKVVIDGLNLMHYLYFNYNLSIVYSGDYDKFANCIRDYFNNLKKCNIEPIVVIDGGSDPSDRKLHRLIERYRKNLTSAYRISKKGEINIQLLPLLCSTVFLEILKELEIVLLQSDFEADEDIAAVANYYNSPVLSNDSDFYLFEVKFGFISLNSLSRHVFKSNDNPDICFLRCEIFKVDNLFKAYPGVTKENFALLGTLIGNDYISISVFDNFFNRIKLPKNKNIGSQRHVKIIGLLRWLTDKTFENAQELVLQTIKLSQRDAIQAIITETILEYQAKTDSLIITLNSGKLKSSPKFITKNGKSIPIWFGEHFRQAQLSSVLSDIIIVNRIYLPPQINHPSSPSGHVCSNKIRLFIYEILLSIDSESVCINIYDRDLWSLKRNHFLLDLQQLKKLNVIEAPEIFSIPEIDIRIRREYFLSALESKEFPIDKFPSEIQFALVALNFYLRNSTPMHEDMFDALLMCLLLLALVFPLNSIKDCAAKTCQAIKINSSQALEVKEILSIFFKHPYHSNAKIFRSDLVHLYSEYQSCLYYAYQLNQLLLCPLATPKLSCLNGSFIYNFCVKLLSKPNTNQYMASLFPKDCDVISFFKTIKETFLSSLPANCVPKLIEQNSFKKKTKSSGQSNKRSTELNNMYKILANGVDS